MERGAGEGKEEVEEGVENKRERQLKNGNESINTSKRKWICEDQSFIGKNRRKRREITGPIE